MKWNIMIDSWDKCFSFIFVQREEVAMLYTQSMW